MSESVASLRRKITSAGDLRSVVRTMKAVAASNIGQYEKSVRALVEYYRTIELGLGACLRGSPQSELGEKKELSAAREVAAVIFGSDQGMVGQFNQLIAEYSIKVMDGFSAKPKVWGVGERVHARMLSAGYPEVELLAVPTAVKAITPLIGQILLKTEAHNSGNEVSELHLFYNHPAAGTSYSPFHLQVLPLNESWRNSFSEHPWPTKRLPESLGGRNSTLRAFIRGYLFVTIYRACAESLASENASRLAAMQRADKNIDDMLDDLNRRFHRLRQSNIDEELFDVVSGFEALSEKKG